MEPQKFIGEKELDELRIFINLCKRNPNVLCHPDLAFFKDYLESLGADIPTAATTNDKAAPQDGATQEGEECVSEEEEEEEIVESDIEEKLDLSEVVAPDDDSAQEMGDPNVEVTEESMEKADQAKSEARQAMAEERYQDAHRLFTEAITLNPSSAMPFANRASLSIKLKKPMAAIRDCDAAIAHNPDSAKAYKYRGKAKAMLGQWVEAKLDLALSCKLDYDEEADEWLHHVASNAKIIEEHDRKYQRLSDEQAARAKAKTARGRQQKHKKAPTNPQPAPGPTEDDLD